MTPSRLLLIALGLLCALALAAAFLPWLQSLWLILAAGMAGLCILDFLLSRPDPRIELTRRIRHSIPVGVWSGLTLILENRAGRALRLKVHDHHPVWFEAESLPIVVTLPAGKTLSTGYRVRPGRRGDGLFPGVDLVWLSPLGLWQRKRFLPRPERVRVFPNFREIARYALLATDHRLSRMGVRRRQRRGEGSDFHQLREYRSGDSLRQIDWKATSRYRRLISKEYQDERDQQLVFMLDCGRRMRHIEQNNAHLDQALNAMLLLSHVASLQGDAVGFLAFGGTNRWFPPQKGGNLVRRLLARTYDLESSTDAADYLSAARELLPRQQRRALIIVMTNTRDEDHVDLITAIQLLQRRHLVVVANLRESALDQTLSQPVADFDGALRYQAVAEYLERRRRSLSELSHRGALVLDLLAPQLPAALVNRYLSIKASNAL